MNSDLATLLVDNSNSRTKFRLCQGGLVGSELRILSTNEISVPAVRNLLRGWAFQSVYVSSVVPRTAEILAASFSCPVHFLRTDKCLPVDFISYPGRETLGADRIANVLGTLYWKRFPCIAVDFGTAITYDVVVQDSDSDIRFAGGVITPGLSLFRDYLSSRTALLPALSDTFTPPFNSIGCDTKHAILSGFMSGTRGMIGNILNDLASALQTSPFVVATGGDAEWVANHLSEIDVVDSLLTFRGLAFFAQSES